MTEAEALGYATKRQKKETVTLVGPSSEYWQVSDALNAAGWTITKGCYFSYDGDNSAAPFQIVAERVIEESEKCPPLPQQAARRARPSQLGDVP